MENRVNKKIQKFIYTDHGGGLPYFKIFLKQFFISHRPTSLKKEKLQFLAAGGPDSPLLSGMSSFFVVLPNQPGLCLSLCEF